MLWSVDQTPYGRSCKHPMVGRPQTLWSVDQATLEWNGPKCRVLGQWFLHKRTQMCNSDFLDCKLKSQKFNYRFDSMSWFYMTLWYQKILEQVNVLLYAAPYGSSGHRPVPLSSKMNEYYTMSQNNIAMNPPSTVQAQSSQSHGQPWSLSLSSRHETAIMAE